ncbi:unnamed protein product [Gongylonema pulchrum]|uniref:Tetratricopeptide repeat protein 21A/21B fifth ARM repeats domain-containing protein n=1 Tax=Gongylonema pulchrum TaxID=637853 RepID=A0A3P7NVC6_9BILA|nr:unnamed protein product [Gongylonema pulchrum]
MARCIELSWRRGDVEQAEKYLKNALDANPRATVDAGFNYCKGLHEWCAKLCLTNVVYVVHTRKKTTWKISARDGYGTRNGNLVIWKAKTYNMCT